MPLRLNGVLLANAAKLFRSLSLDESLLNLFCVLENCDLYPLIFCGCLQLYV